ncbi:MAG TPA: cytochrome c family protein [Allosphingosinicella sp.]|jgi:cytochrome c|nr:cytochrome c family protein [Allosphingosinicella sp.]
MDDRANTIAGWVLFAGIVALGGTIVAGEFYKGERPEKMGYPIEGVQEESTGGGEAAEKPAAFYLAAAKPELGSEVFKKCTACHNAQKGGPNGTGPNLYGVVGAPIAGRPTGFDYSSALKGKGGTWTWDNLFAWLKSPRDFAQGTKMTFAGLSKPEDRANVIAYLNTQSDSPLPLPAAPAQAANPAAAAAEKAGQGDQGEKGQKQPVLTEQQAAQGGKKVAGEGAPSTSGTSSQQKAAGH